MEFDGETIATPFAKTFWIPRPQFSGMQCRKNCLEEVHMKRKLCNYFRWQIHVFNGLNQCSQKARTFLLMSCAKYENHYKVGASASAEQRNNNTSDYLKNNFHMYRVKYTK